MSQSHHTPDTRFEIAGVDNSNNGATFLTNDYVVSQNKSVSFDETPRLALLSTPPLKKEYERATEVVLSFVSGVLRWNHSNYWKRRRGKLKIVKHISYKTLKLFRQHLHIYITYLYSLLLVYWNLILTFESTFVCSWSEHHKSDSSSYTQYFVSRFTERENKWPCIFSHRDAWNGPE